MIDSLWIDVWNPDCSYWIIFTGVEYFHETKVGFEDFVECLVLDLVVLDPEQEVGEDRFVVDVFVVGAIHLHLLDGGLDDFRIVAHWFDEEQFVAHFLDDDVVDHPASFTRRVRCVENLSMIVH